MRSLANLWHSILVSLCVLNRIQFSAPWDPHRSPCG